MKTPMRSHVRSLCALLAALCLISASSAPGSSAAATFTVNDTGDTPDASLGDGTCADAGGKCTLRAAIQEANALAGDDTVNFSVTGTINLSGALPDLSSNVTINGPGANLLTVRRNTGGNYRVFTVASGVTASISGLTVSGGDPGGAQSGGGISNSGTLSLTGVAVSGNTAIAGGGVSNQGTLSLLNCTVSANTLSGFGAGGGISNGGSGTLDVTNSTVSGNNAGAGSGGGISCLGGAVNITNSTVSGNFSGGVANTGGTVTLAGTIVANTLNAGDSNDLSGAFTSNGFNLVETPGSATISEAQNSGTNITGQDPKLGPLADNGGPTKTHALLPGSPAIDKGKNFATDAGNNPVLTDQRGQQRPFDQSSVTNAAGGDGSDIGAYEISGALQPGSTHFLVNTTNDHDGPCTSVECSLRQAINAANAYAGANAIDFSASLNAGGPATINLTGALPDLSDVTITGPGSDILTVRRDTGGDYRVFKISGGTVAISGLTITNGKAPDGVDGTGQGGTGEHGGGIFIDFTGDLTLSNCVVSNNAAGRGGNASGANSFGGQGGRGGGIYNRGHLSMTGCTVTGNRSGQGGGGSKGSQGGSGGGLSNEGTGTLTITSCTFSDNLTGDGGPGDGSFTSGGFGGFGGGLDSSGQVSITGTTFSGNVTGNGGQNGGGGWGGGYGGGVFVGNGTTTLTNCVVRDNRTGTAAPPAGKSGEGGYGGGLYNISTLVVSGSTISGNQTGASGPGASGGHGGGVGNGGTLTMTNSTVSGNTTGGPGGQGAGVWNYATANLTNCTVYANSSAATSGGAGVHNLDNNGATTKVRNTIIAGNTPSNNPSVADVGGTFTSQGHNFVGNADGSGGFSNGVKGDQIGTFAAPLDPHLGPLADNGGPTKTHALLLGSPAIDAGDNSLAVDAGNSPLTTDQRGAGFPRVVNSTVDVGAFELQNFVVNTTADTDDGTCAAAGTGNGCTLREAINAVNSHTSSTTIITFAPALTTGGPATINLTGALPNINADMTIAGPGPNLLTVRRNTGGVYRIFNIPGAANVTISGLTVTNGLTPDGVPGNQPVNMGGFGGGILNAGVLTLTDVVVTGNSTGNGGAASGPFSGGFGGFGGFGGGISSSGTLTMTNCTVSNNTTGHGGDGTYGGPGGLGGGVQFRGTLNMTHCLVAGNSTGTGAVGSSSNGGGGDGGGIYAGDATNFNSATLNLTDTVVSGNHTADAGGPNADGGHGGGILLEKGTGTLTNCTVSNNTTGKGTGFSGQGGSGGGVFNNSLATMTVIGCTVTGNSTGTNGSNGGGGGGGVVNGGAMNMINSTVSGNTTNGVGGTGAGLFNSGTTTLTNCTVAFNSAAATTFGGAGIHTFSNQYVVTLGNTLVARNTLANGQNGPDVSGTFTSQGHNFVGVADSNSTGLSNGVNGDQVGTSAAPLDPLLGPLQNNGGLTLTHLLLPASPAVNAGSNALAKDQNNNALTTDQRGAGFPRVVNTTVDIGAVEVSYAISATAGAPQSTPIKTAFGAQLKATVKESGNVKGGIPVTFTAPAAGASGTFPGGLTTATVNTDSNGVATAPVFTANGTAGGPYNVTARLSNAGPSVNFALTNLKGDQTISFGPLPDRTFGDADFQLSATASSGLPVSFASMSPGPCTVSGSTVHLTGAGVCAISASQAGDNNYNAAAAVVRFLNIAPAPTSLALSSSPNPSSVGQSVTFTATVTSPAGTPPGGILGGVTFFDGGVMIPNCSVPLSSGQAACTTSALSFGGHTITAEYSTTNPDFAGSKGTLQGGQAVNGGFQFSQGVYAVSEAGGELVITVRRDGDLSQPASVDYATDDGSIPSVAVPCSAVTGLALERCDYTRAAGTLQFAPGDTQKTFAVLVNSDSYQEGTEATTLRLSNPVGDVLGQQSSATLQILNDAQQTTNPVDDAQFFVTQHYADFLNREPDLPGLQFWRNGITSCGSDADCVAVKRVDTSAAFFLSIEFQETGYFVERMYKTAFGDATGNSTFPSQHTLSVPVVRLDEFLIDTQRIGRGVVVGQGDWQAQLEANKQAFAQEFVQRQRFQNAGLMSAPPAQYVDRLNRNAGGVLTQAERDELVAQLSSNDTLPARVVVLRAVAESPALAAAEKDRAFVLMQFFGYLRRNPDDAPDADYTGYDFWLSKLDQFNGDFVQAEMVKAFINSTEYRQRFGQ